MLKLMSTLLCIFIASAEVFANQKFFYFGSSNGSIDYKSARAYIQDGLVAMWDGIENVGYGIHDNNATVWKDIAGDWDASLFGSNHWSGDAWVVESVSGDNKGYAHFSCPNMPESQTWQFVVHPTNYLGYNAGSRLITITGFQPRIMATNGISMYSSYGATFGTSLPDFNALDLHAHTITHEKDSPNINYWIDGRLVYTSSSASGNSTSALNGYFANNSALNRGIDALYYSVRLYNRVLTDDEIEYNAMIDRLRFGISQ